VQYDASGLPTVITDARGFSTTNQYDAQGNLTNVIDAKSFATRIKYDGVGRKIRQIDPLNHATSFVYDNDNNLLFTTNALNFVNAFIYDANNNRTSSQNPRNAITTNVFDLKDRLIAMLAPLNQTNGTLYDALDRKIATFDALGNQTEYAYDDVGILIAVTNALKQVTRFTSDPQGNQTSVIDPTGHYITNFFDALNRKVATINVSISTNSTAFDALGRVSATTNANNQVTQFFYDSIGRLTNVVDSANQPVFFAYDENGNRVRTTDPNGHTWTNILDELNQLVEQDDPGTNKTSLHYDPVGNLTNKDTAISYNINYNFDALNRLTNIAYPSGPPVTFGYDEVGNRTNMVDGLGTTTWQFDLLNRLKSVIDPYGQTVANGFDANGNRVRLTYPGNKVVNFGFDTLNRMTALTNWLNGVVTYGYDSRGNLLVATNANGTTVSYAYDVADRLVGLTNAAPDASVIAAYALTLDAVGNHRQATHNQPLFPILPTQTNNYTYDSDNRLTTNDGLTVTHNANGDLTGIGTNSYTYDFEDRLVQFSLTNTSNTFTYDGLGNRLARMVNGQARCFVLDRMGALTQVLAETDTNNSPVAYYVYGLGLAERISSDGMVATYHFNIQGSTVALTDSGGNITDSYAYDSFGVLANSDGDSPQPFRYLGQYGIVDDSTGLLYARARYFSPQLGRFLTKDPVTGKDSDSQSLNRYIYALNSPLAFYDVTGLCAGNNSSSQFLLTRSPVYFFTIVGQDLAGIGDAVVDLARGTIALPRTIVYGWANLPTTINEIANNPSAVASTVFSQVIAQPLLNILNAFSAGNNREGTRLLAPLVTSFLIGPEGSATEEGATYENLFEAPISGTTRSAHRASANNYLANELQNDPGLANTLNQELGSDVLQHMQSGSSLLNPPGTVWHHPFDNPNVVQLLRSEAHTDPSLQYLLHPNGIGGFGTFYGP
jgi:RHS repeat-associated protein